MVNRSRENRRQNAPYRAYAMLRFAIKSSGLPKGFAIDEHSIMSNFGFSRASVRDALRRLDQDGLVSRKVSLGTIIEKEPVAFPIDDIVPSRSDQVMTYRRIDQYVLTSSGYFTMKLGNRDDRIVMGEYELSIGSVVIGILTVFSAGTGPSIGSVLETSAEMHRLEEQFPLEYGVQFGGIDVSVDARVADAEVAELLGIAEGDPLLVREQVFRDVDGVIWEYGFAQYRADLVILTSQSDGRGVVPQPRAWQSDFNDALRINRSAAS